MVGENNMFNKIKSLFGVGANVNPAPTQARPEPPPLPPVKKSAAKSEKEIATAAGEPYVAMMRMDIDPDNLHQGAFELDWNEIFISRLVKAGYMIKREDTDADIVDRWFQNVCRHVVMETWEQEQAIKQSGIYVQTKPLGNGRSEVS
jgi:hypothetical protein